jgi:hypothetical protein
MSYSSLRLPDLALDGVTASHAAEIANLESVHSVVVLPDGFTKEKYIAANYKITVPSSSVIVSKQDVLYPQFRSRGIGCGMAAVALPLQK